MKTITTYRLECIKEGAAWYDIPSKKMNAPEAAAAAFNEVFKLQYAAEENLCLFTLNTKHEIIGAFVVSVGCLNSAIVHPREIYKRALLTNAAALILAHNHPSGDVTPSNEDIKITLRLIEAGKILGIELLDHLIIGDNKEYSSLRELSLI